MGLQPRYGFPRFAGGIVALAAPVRYNAGMKISHPPIPPNWNELWTDWEVQGRTIVAWTGATELDSVHPAQRHILACVARCACRDAANALDPSEENQAEHDKLKALAEAWRRWGER